MFQSQEFTPTFNFPHLRKCTYSFVIKHDVTNVECKITVNGEQLTGTTKWEDEGVWSWQTYCVLPAAESDLRALWPECNEG
jgi:hypothetical protein